MATRNSARSRASRPAGSDRDALKRRVEKTGCKLLRDCMGKLYILDPRIDELLAVGLDEKTIEHELEYLEGEGRRGIAVDRVRRAAMRVVKAYRESGQDIGVAAHEAFEDLEKALSTGGAA